MGVADRLKHAWNAFLKDPTIPSSESVVGYYYRPDRPRLTRGKDRTIVTSVFNRIAMDAAAVDIEHVRLDEENRYIETIKSGLNNCLTTEANIDQTGRAFIQDVVFSMLDEGVVAVVPVDTDFNPTVTGSYDILTMRTAKIIEWYPKYIKVSIYNENTGKKEELTLPKKVCAIIENPLYATINEYNSTAQRLMRKLVLIDAVDEETGSGKLNMIIQLPYIIKTESRRQQAENRRKDIEEQLAGSKYGIAYADGTEKIMQLNRPLENNLLAQIEYLTSMLYSQLGMTDAVLNGTASEEEMQNYYSRTIEPMLAAITDEMRRKFLTKTARTQRQDIKYFRDPFKLITVSSIAEIGDTLTRNEIMTSNEFRQILGLKPSDSPRADELVNKNMPVEDLGLQNEDANAALAPDPASETDYQNMSGELDSFDSQLDEIEDLLNHSALVHKAYASPYYDPEKAHEYYMKNRELKGRRSLSGLNDEGQAAAKYVKNKLDEERDKRIGMHKNTTDSAIEKSKQKMSSRIESYGRATANSIQANTNRMDTQIEQNTEQMKNEIDQVRDSVKSAIKSHSKKMNNQIKALRNKLSNLSPKQRKAHKEEVQEVIDMLREQNASQRENLQDAFSEFSGNTRAANKAENAGIREETAALNNNLRDRQKSENAKAQEAHASESGKLNEEHARVKGKLTSDYESKYDDELEKIFNDPNFLKPPKSGGKGSGKKGGSSKSSGNSGGSKRSYKGRASKVKAIMKKHGL